MAAQLRLQAICKFAIPSPRALRVCVSQKKMLSHCWIVQGIVGHVLTHDGGCGGLAVVGGKSQMPSRKRWGRRVRLWEEASDAHWLHEWGRVTCRSIGTLGKSTSMILLSVLRVIEDSSVSRVSSFSLGYFYRASPLVSCVDGRSGQSAFCCACAQRGQCKIICLLLPRQAVHLQHQLDLPSSVSI